jgi:hypothetical protein
MIVIFILTGILAPVAFSAEDIRLSAGQTVYVPIYSHIYSGVKGRPFDLAATLRRVGSQFYCDLDFGSGSKPAHY